MLLVLHWMCSNDDVPIYFTTYLVVLVHYFSLSSQTRIIVHNVQKSALGTIFNSNLICTDYENLSKSSITDTSGSW